MLSASYSSRWKQEYSKLHLPQLRQSLLPFLISSNFVYAEDKSSVVNNPTPNPFLISSNLVHAETAEKSHRMFLIFDKLFFLRKPSPIPYSFRLPIDFKKRKKMK